MKRVVPVPDYDIADIQRRTIIVENLPPALTIGGWGQLWNSKGRTWINAKGPGRVNCHKALEQQLSVRCMGHGR